MKRLARFLPVFDWAPHYDRSALTRDAIAAVIVTVMLVPQSIAYALLAGLPAEVGLYASMAALLAYALLGTSRTLSVGPVAVVSLMTAAAASEVAAQGSPEYVAAALILALLSGVMLMGMGALRLGFLANLLSYPVVSGFIMASAVVIALSQLRHVLGIPGSGQTLPDMLRALLTNLAGVHGPTAAIGATTLVFLLWSRKGLAGTLRRAGLSSRTAELASKLGPVVAVIASVALVASLRLDQGGVAIVGAIPKGLPPLTAPSLDAALWSSLLMPALLISIVGFVESLSVAQTLAAKRRQRISPNQELLGLGAANVAVAFSGGYPVTGGFARSVVNFDAGARTPAAGAYTALGIAIVTVFLTPLLYFLPVAVLASTIIVAVISLVEVRAIVEVWRYSKSDFGTMAATIGVTLLWGLEAGITAGVVVSLALYVWRASRPHAAIVGRVPGTEHFRNVLRHDVETEPTLLTLRVDESLTFLNARWLESYVQRLISEHPAAKDVVLMCSSINEIDVSGLASLEAVNRRLADAGVRMHLSEVKGPVLDRLERSSLLEQLTGRVFLSQFDAFQSVRTPRVD